MDKPPTDARLTVLIVDDEPLARDSIRVLLADDPGVGSILEASNGEQALASIRTGRPDLVLLDVQMPRMDGFAVVRKIGAANMPQVIFVTAHDQYAIQAFEVNAIDYLLKPVSRERFAAALQRARFRLTTRQLDRQQIVSLLESIASPRRLKRIAIRMSGRTHFIDVDDIEWIKAAENYVELHAGETSHLLHGGINKLEEWLDPETFMRIHRSFIVNTARVKEVAPSGISTGEYILTLSSGTRLKSGRKYDQQVRRLIANPF